MRFARAMLYDEIQSDEGFLKKLIKFASFAIKISLVSRAPRNLLTMNITIPRISFIGCPSIMKFCLFVMSFPVGITLVTYFKQKLFS